MVSEAYKTADGTLVIPDCRPVDAGRYVCTITLVTGAQSQSTATLTIDTRPAGAFTSGSDAAASNGTLCVR